jgi:hypothetical protein
MVHQGGIHNGNDHKKPGQRIYTSREGHETYVTRTPSQRRNHLVVSAHRRHRWLVLSLPGVPDVALYGGSGGDRGHPRTLLVWLGLPARVIL